MKIENARIEDEVRKLINIIDYEFRDPEPATQFGNRRYEVTGKLAGIKKQNSRMTFFRSQNEVIQVSILLWVFLFAIQVSQLLIPTTDQKQQCQQRQRKLALTT